MKLKGIFYLSEPKDIEKDLIEAHVLTEPEGDEPGGYEYSMSITTPRYIAEEMKKNGFFYSSPFILVVERLEDKIIIEIIKSLLPIIDKIAFRSE